MYTTLEIEYGTNDNILKVPYSILASNIAQKWAGKLAEGLVSSTLDAPDRFYGFSTAEEQANDALHRINSCIETINLYKHIINRTVLDCADQDTLNYLHHKFEVYHGLLDMQHDEYWQSSPATVKAAIAELNISVHRCESVMRGNNARHVATWYSMPKTSVLEDADYSEFTPEIVFGTVYLNYAEIGKTFEDLAYDTDSYIAPAAFKPFRHYSADFNIKFWNSTKESIEAQQDMLKLYYKDNRSFFNKQGLDLSHNYMRAGYLPVATYSGSLTEEELLTAIKTRQYVNSVNLT